MKQQEQQRLRVQINNKDGASLILQFIGANSATSYSSSQPHARCRVRPGEPWLIQKMVSNRFNWTKIEQYFALSVHLNGYVALI